MSKRNFFKFTLSAVLLLAFIALIGPNWFLAFAADSSYLSVLSNEAASETVEYKKECGPGQPPFYGCPAYIFNARPVESSTNPTSKRVCGPGQPPFYGCPAYIFNTKPVRSSTNPTSERICGPGQSPFYGCPAYIFNTRDP